MLEGLQPPQKEALCAVMSRAASLSKEDLKSLQEALDTPAWSHEALSNELTNRGFIIGRDAIRKHRRKICSCAR